MSANFNDNLYAEMSIGGCGLYGCCDGPSWFYERHSRHCAPGKWIVGLCSPEPGDFWPLVTARADAVVDDFGNLAKV